MILVTRGIKLEWRDSFTNAWGTLVVSPADTKVLGKLSYLIRVGPWGIHTRMTEILGSQSLSSATGWHET